MDFSLKADHDLTLIELKELLGSEYILTEVNENSRYHVRTFDVAHISAPKKKYSFRKTGKGTYLADMYFYSDKTAERFVNDFSNIASMLKCNIMDFQIDELVSPEKFRDIERLQKSLEAAETKEETVEEILGERVGGPALVKFMTFTMKEGKMSDIDFTDLPKDISDEYEIFQEEDYGGPDHYFEFIPRSKEVQASIPEYEWENDDLLFNKSGIKVSFLKDQKKRDKQNKFELNFEIQDVSNESIEKLRSIALDFTKRLGLELIEEEDEVIEVMF